ncbi:family 8 glycosyl transferase [Dactylonectria macrodidyma]|uniref:glycogenin glucosyltransferase n=1 Tax=Dactylonectria macrodidyma TaxID=307937 RepID=A0A9P9JAZ9_9HYPO|nr:family 8 glycosyl transferase [Dactylonectria macrodidyma]
MAAPGGNHVYATLLLSDSYLPGALVLAHSLRDAGTRIKLAVLVTLDSVSAESIAQLRTVYDYIFPVPRIRNDRPANLYLMNRADLHSAFTKINLWKFTEFSKIVYIDADVVAYRAPDELFNIARDFAAAPDIGWPDLFNTGVMVITPNMGDYYAMMAMAERGISFDGADQGLINMHFGNRYDRLSFTYNVTPSAHYQYVPAYRHFQSSINMVHFIGSEKPWFTGRHAPHGSGPFDEMIGRWWAVYDRHYRAKESAPEQTPPPSEYVQYLTKGEFHPRLAPAQQGTGEHGVQGLSDSAPQRDFHSSSPSHDQPVYHHHEHHHEHEHDHGHNRGEHDHHHEPHHDSETQAGTSDSDSTPNASHFDPQSESVSDASRTQAEARSEQQESGDHPHHPHHHPHHHEGGAPPAEHKPEPPPILMHSWDAQRQPPPADSKPEAIDFPSTHYEMSQDTTPFVPPVRYPSPPRNMWYEVPKERPAPRSQAPVEIFPWERNRPPPTRSFVDEPPEPVPSEEPQTEDEPQEDSSVVESMTTDAKSEPSTPTTPALKTAPLDPWTSFTRVNAWDEVPEIERYVEGLQGHRRGKSSGSSGRSGGIQAFGKGDGGKLRLHGLKLTDFPTETERPSLPVTPAPIRRPSFWSGGDAEATGGDEPRQLPEAEGVPAQTEWDPTEQLQKLAQKQSDVLLQKFGSSGEEEDREHQEGESTGVSREIPSRPLPFGSEDVTSSTYVAQSTPGVLSPQPVKGEATTSILPSISNDNFDPALTPKPSSIPLPSFSGPGAAWEKDDAVLERQTPLLPTEEERDVLDT